ESTNPLFRGFGNDEDEEAERYNEPVIVRLGTRDADELRDGFPKSAEELFQYHAIVLDDVEAGYFDEEQKSLIQEFVNTRGGGFLMLGGQETFRQGEYDRTPIGELLPVYIDTQIAKPADTGYQLNLTREGWLQPWVRLESTEEEEEQRLEAMPRFDTINVVRSIKPGASILSTVSTPDTDELPALVAQRFGKGRAAALLIGDFWKWHLRNERGNEDLLKSWRQTMRWLVADVPRRVDVEVRENRDANLSVQLRVQVNDATYRPLDNATVTVDVTRPDGVEVSLSATPLDEAAGLFGVTYVPRVPGPYRVDVEARAADGSVIGKRQNGWVSEPANDEFSQLRPNREFLRRVAQKTGGEVVEIDELDRFAAGLPARKAPLMETRISPWWHTATIFLLALGCFVFEWGLRRWKGLP
ncbi:MAG: glutamine amidotransferase, partial [Pirellulaceae bacterium]